MRHALPAKPNPALPFRRFFLVCGLVMLFSEIWKQLTLTFTVNGGAYLWWYFPFQLCSIPMYVLLALPFSKKESVQKALMTFLMTFGLLGGMIVFADTSGLHYTLPALTAHSYSWHILLTVIGIAAGTACGSFLTLRDFRNAALLYLSCCLLAAVFNRAFDSFGEINLFYINPRHAMEQVVFTDLVPALGLRPVILLYIFMTVMGAGILWLVWHAVYRFIRK